jgi:hypothetical protein
MDEQAVIDATRRWVSTVVIGLGLCPFALRVFQGEKIRYAVSDAGDGVSLLDDLIAELEALASGPVSVVETTLLIHPRALGNFLDYNDFLGDADRLVQRLGLTGTIQLASFHPDYRFAGTEPDAAENYTNRSPYPMLHLLREESVAAAAAVFGEMQGIPRRNVEMLKRLGREKVSELLRAARGGGPLSPCGGPIRRAHCDVRPRQGGHLALRVTPLGAVPPGDSRATLSASDSLAMPALISVW